MTRKKFPRIIAISVSITILFLSSVLAADMKCAECGMTVNQESKFYAWIVQDKNALPFCDIGDLLMYLNRKSLSPAAARVKDYLSGEMIDADKAFYVRAEKTFKTPMGWGIAAFKDKQEAEKFGAVMDFSGAAKAVK